MTVAYPTADRESDPDYDMHCRPFTRRVTLEEYVDLIKAVDVSNDVYMVANNRNLDNPELAPSWTTSGLTHPSFVKTGGGVAQRSGWDPQNHHTSAPRYPQYHVHSGAWSKARAALPTDGHDTLGWGALFNRTNLDPELDNHRAFDQMLVVDLEPGDALFTPIGWWHHVRALDLSSISLAVTHFHPHNRYDWYVPRSATLIDQRFKAFEIDQVGLRR